MIDKEKNIKSRIKLLINNIDEFNYKFVTYKAESMKSLLEDILEYINNKEKACKEWKEEYRAKVEELNELEEKPLCKEQECEELKHKVELMMDCASCKIDKYKQTLIEIIRFFKEDEKFARYSGRPIIFAKPALEKIEKILKGNDIKIS